jgi:hypothetical protein
VEYPHRVRVSAPGSVVGGQQDWDTGMWEPTSPDDLGTILYVGRADVQETQRRVAFAPDGSRTLLQLIAVYLADPAAVNRIPPGAITEVRFEDGTVRHGEVLDVSRIDGRLNLERLQ